MLKTIKARWKRTVATLALLGFMLVALAGPAQAYSYTQGPEKWQWDRSGIYCGVWAYVDYNWWEETFQNKHDGWQRLYWAYC